jgi:hypothetical protein
MGFFMALIERSSPTPTHKNVFVKHFSVFLILYCCPSFAKFITLLKKPNDSVTETRLSWSVETLIGEK